MKLLVKRYHGDGIEVTYDPLRCTHVAECVRGLPEVFDTRRRPWVKPQNGTADDIAMVIVHCPTGALHFIRTDGGEQEAAPEKNRLMVASRGPLYVRGQVRLVSADGDILLEDVRMALCRCGLSENKPLCDNSHLRSGFMAPGTLGVTGGESEDEGGELKITARRNGPLRLEGNFELISSDRRQIFRGTEASLCRCGGSMNKPFCDNTHEKNGFQAE